MKCPYCTKDVYGLTGLMELKAFVKHLKRCRKNPNNIVITDGKRTIVTPIKNQGIDEALKIRGESGQ